MNTVGYITYVAFFWEVTLPDTREHVLRHFTVQPAHTVYFLTSVASESRHTETFARITRVDTTHIHQFVPSDTHALWITTHVLAEETFVEVVVTSRNRSVNSIQRRRTNNFHCFVECQTAFNVVAQTLYVAQCSVTFVAVIDILLDTELLQHQHTTDTQEDFLLQAVFPVATIKLVSDRTVEFAVHFIICIEQIQRHTTYVYSPYICMYIIVQIRNIDYHRLTVFVHYAVNWQATEVLSVIVSNLLAIHSKALCEITVTVQETNTTHINIAV